MAYHHDMEPVHDAGDWHGVAREIEKGGRRAADHQARENVCRAAGREWNDLAH